MTNKLKTKKWGTLTLLTVTMLTANLALASTKKESSSNTSEAEVSLSNRMEKKVGVYAGILGDPHPTLFGINVAYNVTDYLRASAGFGQITVTSGLSLTGSGLSTQEETITTLGAAAKFLVPGWSISPAGTLGFSHVIMSDGAILSDYKENNLYVGLGGDWQMSSGIYLGLGMNISVTGSAPTAPYLNAGYFF